MSHVEPVHEPEQDDSEADDDEIEPFDPEEQFETVVPAARMQSERGYAHNNNAITERNSQQVTSTKFTVYKQSEPLLYGIIPSSTISQLQDVNDWQARASAVEEINTIISDSKSSSMYLNHLKELLMFICSLLNDKNFKISLTAYLMISTVLERVGTPVKAVLGHIIPSLCDVGCIFFVLIFRSLVITRL